MTYKQIEVRPITPSLGAEIHGADLSAAIDDALLAEIRRALVEHLVIFFRDQRLSPEQQIAFTARIGPVSRVPFIKPLDDYPDIIAVLKEADERKISTFGGTWHSDFSFLEAPPLGSVLYALEVPNSGGDTLWANMYDAYETLSPGMKALLDGLTAIHTGAPYGTTDAPPPDMQTSRSIAISRNDRAADVETEHPVVLAHPDSGRKALFVNAVYTSRFKDMTREESKPLLNYLYAHATRPEFTCRFRWTRHALALWDNRCTQHLAINDYDGHRRLMHRTTIAGERPRGSTESYPVGPSHRAAE